MTSWKNFYKNLQQDLKLFLYLWGLMELFRVGFIAYMHSYIGNTTTSADVFAALYYGLRISLKSAGFMTVGSILLCSAAVFLRRNPDKLRYGLGCIYTTGLSLLFFARIPYYEQFHMGYNQLLFNTFQDDVFALGVTISKQYNLPLRFFLLAVTVALFAKVLQLWLRTGIVKLPEFSRGYYNILLRAAFLIVVYFVVIFIRFGGSLTYAYNIDWENSGLTKDPLLNEAILDDVQALYRAYELHERLTSSTGIDIDPAQLTADCMAVSGKNLSSGSIDAYLQKTAQGSVIKKPKHIFLIIGESYANWPLLPEYKDVNVANGVKNIIRQDNAAYVPTFLPNGMSTISGVIGVVTGLPDVNLYLNYLPEAYQGPFSTAIAPQLKRLGYQARFWYAGPSTWEKVKDFTLAQGFDDFHGRGDFPSAGGNVWGCDDEYLFKAVSDGISADQPSFNVILTVSNHAPFTVDLASAGFDQDQVVSGLPPEKRDDQTLVKQLGHFWYADKMLADFITRTKEKYPDSLFLIMGDHADRLNIEANPGLYKRYGIPFIAYGPGITKDTFPATAAGSHIDVAATLIELIAPRGFTYYSLGDSLTRGNSLGMNYGFWVTAGSIGRLDPEDAIETIPNGSNEAGWNIDTIHTKVDQLRSIAWWRIKHGDQITNP